MNGPHNGEGSSMGRCERTRLIRPLIGLAVVLTMLSGCAERRDVADLAVGIAPFEQLRGMDAAALRSGGVRAFRRSAEPAPFEGLREPIGAYDVLFGTWGFDGSDGSWPSEDALVMSIEATREWPSDSSALLAWQSAVREIFAGLSTEPVCSTITGPGFSLRVAEWDRGNGWSLSASLAPAVRSGTDSTLTPRHSLAVRRQALTSRFPMEGQPNPEARPTWSSTSCTPAIEP